MREVIIEDEVKYKLADLKQELLVSQGQVKGTKTFNSILSAIDNLEIFDVGRNIKDEFYVECPDNWFLLYSNKNYFIFSRTDSLVTVLKMYNEKQDFIYDLFGIEMRSQESKDYWGE